MPTTEYAADAGTALIEAEAQLTPITFIGRSQPVFDLMNPALIVGSLTNPRKYFAPAPLAELAASIKGTGLHQPVLIRPLPASRLQETFAERAKNAPLPTHEVVTGERRWRACTMAELLLMPVLICDLPDEVVLEIQIVENLQRQDLTELEEAEGYELLMQHAGINADQVGAKIGKSKSYVYARLKLLDLHQAPRKALREGTIDASKALLIARIPSEKLQNKALDDLTEKSYYKPYGMSAREAAEHVQRNYMLQLGQARFTITDATLVPAAGSCKECPKRTGAAPDLFADVKGADVCTDPTCFHKKEDAHAAVLVENAKAKGQTVIAGKEAQELLTGGWKAKLKGYRRLDVVDDSPTDQPLRKIIGAQMKAEGIQPVMIEGQKSGELVATLPNDVALRLLKAVEGQAEAAKTVSKEVRAFAEDKKAKALEKAKAQYEQGWRKLLLSRTWGMLKGGGLAAFTLDVHRLLAVRAVNSLSVDDVKEIGELLGLGKVGTHSALIDFAKTTTAPDLLQLLMIAQGDSGAYDYSYDGSNRVPNVGLMLIAGIVFGDGLSTVTSGIQAEAMDKYMPRAKAPKPDLPLASAAQASTSRAKANAEKSKAPAAPDGAKPTLRKRKTTAQEAMEGIADAMQGIEASALADAGSPADVGAPAGAAGDAVPGSAAALQGEEAPALAGARPVMYRCAKTGSTWSGRGQKPAWVKAHIEGGGTLDDLQADASHDAAPIDPQYAGALALIIREQKASLRLLKIEMGIGQAKAERLLSALEAAGKVSACDERGARTVLL